MPAIRPARYAKNIGDAARALGVSTHSLQRWAQTSGCPCKREHKIHGLGYDLQLMRRWVVRNGYAVDPTTGRLLGERRGRVSEDSATDGKPSIALQFKTAQAEEKRAKAALAQLELKQREGEVHSIEECQEQDRKRHLYMKATLESWSRSLGPVLSNKSALVVTTIMTEKVHEVMAIFAGDRPGYDDDYVKNAEVAG